MNFSTSLSIGTVSLKNQDLNYKTVLGLKKDPFSPEPDPSFNYAFDSHGQRLTVFKKLVEGTDNLVLVSGQPGSGKTTLLNRYFASSVKMWKPCRLRADPAATSHHVWMPPRDAVEESERRQVECWSERVPARSSRMPDTVQM